MAKCKKVDPSTCPAGAGMSGMGPPAQDHGRLAHLVTVGSFPTHDHQDLNCTYLLVCLSTYRVVCTCCMYMFLSPSWALSLAMC